MDTRLKNPYHPNHLASILAQVASTTAWGSSNHVGLSLLAQVENSHGYTADSSHVTPEMLFTCLNADVVGNFILGKLVLSRNELGSINRMYNIQRTPIVEYWWIISGSVLVSHILLSFRFYMWRNNHSGDSMNPDLLDNTTLPLMEIGLNVFMMLDSRRSRTGSYD